MRHNKGATARCYLAAWLYLLVLILLILFATPRAAGVLQAQGFGAEDVWDEPVNLSRSGAAEQPVVVPGPNDRSHVFWQDRFDGLMTSVQAEGDWSTPQALPLFTPPLEEDEERVPVTTMPDLLVSQDGTTHALWLSATAPSGEEDDTSQGIWYAQRSERVSDWSTPVALAASVLTWVLREDTNGTLHFWYLRPEQTVDTPAGLYYRRSTDRGASWSNGLLLHADIYVRVLPAEQAHIAAAVGSDDSLHVVWDAPRLRQAFYLSSTNSGNTWTEAIPFGSAEGAIQTQVAVSGSGELVRAWQIPAPSGQCSRFQQRSIAGGRWMEPEPLLNDLTLCPTRWSLQTTAKGELLWLGVTEGESGADLALAAWDGTQWSGVERTTLSFSGEESDQLITLIHPAVTLAGDRLMVAGQGFADSEIWAVESQIEAVVWAFAPAPAWATPAAVTQGPGVPSLPAMAADAAGQIHLVWAEALGTEQATTTLRYARWDGERWSRPTPLESGRQASLMRAEAPALVAVGQQLHLVWSDGASEQLLYSRAGAATAGSAGWSAPRPLPLPQAVGCCPTLAADSQGHLHLVYAVPLNEERGLYYTRSEDGGDTWQTPIRLFDAAVADWTMLLRPHLVVVPTGQLHVVWERATLSNDGSSVPTGIFYSRSTDGGTRWEPPMALAEGAFDWPQLAMLASGQVQAVWQEEAQSLPTWRFRRSEDGGRGWDGMRLIDGFAGVAAPVGLVSTGQALYLIGIGMDDLGQGDLRLSSWNGTRWTVPERVALGGESDEGTAVGVQAALGQLLVTFYGKQRSAEGSPQPALWSTLRTIPTVVVTPAPTFTPIPTSVPTGTPVPEPTITPVPDLGAIPPAPRLGGRIVTLALSSVLATIVVGVVFAVSWSRR